MADTNEKVMAYVEKALAQNPDIPGDELYEGAKKVDKSIGKMTRRQFHAKYPLQVKRKANAGKPRKAGKRKTATRKTTARKKAKAKAKTRSGGARRAASPRRAPAAPAAFSRRDAIRGSLLSFALELASADDADVVKVMAGVDQYVDQIVGHMR